MVCVIVAQYLYTETYIWVNTLREIAQEVLTNIILNVYSDITLKKLQPANPWANSLTGFTWNRSNWRAN